MSGVQEHERYPQVWLHLKEITKWFRVDAAPKGKMVTCMQKLACCNPNPKASPELLLMRCSLWDINLVAKNKKGYSIKVLMKQSGIQTLPCFHKLFYAKSKCMHQIYHAIHLQFSNEFFRSLLCDPEDLKTWLPTEKHHQSWSSNPFLVRLTIVLPDCWFWSATLSAS